MFWCNEELDASGDAGFAADQSGPIEVEDHLMDRGRADTKVTLDVGFGGGPSEDTRINADEGQVLALLFGEALRDAAACAV